MVADIPRRSHPTGLRIIAKAKELDRPAAGTDPVCRIAVLRSNHRPGNTLLLTPLICELEAMFPGAEIEIVSAGRAAQAVFAEFEQVSAVHAFPARRSGGKA